MASVSRNIIFDDRQVGFAERMHRDGRELQRVGAPRGGKGGEVGDGALPDRRGAERHGGPTRPAHESLIVLERGGAVGTDQVDHVVVEAAAGRCGSHAERCGGRAVELADDFFDLLDRQAFLWHAVGGDHLEYPGRALHLLAGRLDVVAPVDDALGVAGDNANLIALR